VDLARSAVGIAVRAGAPKPDIGTAEALRRSLLAARSIGYARSGASGLHFAKVIARLGIADTVNRKAIVRDGFVGEMAAHGEVELAVQQVSELMVVPGIDVVGPLPDDLQENMVFSAGLFASAPHAAEAAMLIAWLRRPETARIVIASGLIPV
jgi:molybdate transport system substrate-binding protein